MIEDVLGIVSLDGKTFRTRVDGTDAQGQTYHNELIFDRQ